MRVEQSCSYASFLKQEEICVTAAMLNAVGIQEWKELIPRHTLKPKFKLRVHIMTCHGRQPTHPRCSIHYFGTLHQKIWPRHCNISRPLIISRTQSKHRTKNPLAQDSLDDGRLVAASCKNSHELAASKSKALQLSKHKSFTHLCL